MGGQTKAVMTSVPQRWARVRPEFAWKHPGVPRDWTPVLEEHPDGVQALPGYVWLDPTGKPLHVREAWLEFQ
jgi:hypothetical protein